MSKLKTLMKKNQFFVLVILIVYCVVVASINPSFATLQNAFDIVRNLSVTMVFAMGVLLVLISGGIDVSFAIIAVFSAYASILVSKAMNVDNLAMAFLIAAVVGALLGAINASLIHFFKIPIFIATLGTQTMFTGLMAVILGTVTIKTPQMPTSLVDFGTQKLITITVDGGQIYGLYIYIIPVVAIIAITAFILYKTRMGRSIVAMGNDVEAAKRAGYNLLTTRMFLYILVGIFSSVAGIMYVSQVAWIAPLINNLVGSTELTTIAAVVIGGTKVTGGSGTISGTILGVLLIQVISSTLIFLGLSSSWNDLFQGIVLIACIIVTSVNNHRTRKKLLLFD